MLPPISFMSGSQAGQISCESVPVLDDNVAEEIEDFKLLITTTNEDRAALIQSTITVSILDDNGMDLFNLTHILMVDEYIRIHKTQKQKPI